MAISSELTIFDSLLASLQKAADYNRDDTERPAAVLWPDENKEWESLIPRLRAALPQFLTLGPYDVASRSGPAIWLRYVLAGKIDAVTLPTRIADCRAATAGSGRAQRRGRTLQGARP
jgi:hypothetical protein